MLNLTPKQRIAHSSPCFEAEETTNPRFLDVVRTRRRMATRILTANIGLE